MRKIQRRELVRAVFCLTAAAVIAFACSGFITWKIREESSSHLTELYAQVNNSFGMLVSRNWNLLDSWKSYIADVAGTDYRRFGTYIGQQRDRWGFSDFYFIGQGGGYRSVGGEQGVLDVSRALDRLLEDGEDVVLDETLPGGEGITLFASQVRPGTYREFPYSTVAISYNSGDMAQALSVNAFSGRGECLVVRGDGRILISTQHEYQGRIPNLLAFLEENAAFRGKSEAKRS